jgi:hypothetical protein
VTVIVFGRDEPQPQCVGRDEQRRRDSTAARDRRLGGLISAIFLTLLALSTVYSSVEDGRALRLRENASRRTADPRLLHGRRRMRVLTITVLGALTLAGCHPAGGWFSRGPAPAQLAGFWVDSARSSSTDSSIWVLTPEGVDRRVRIRLLNDRQDPRVKRDDSKFGRWYLSGDMSDSLGRALCTVRRARDGGSCMTFRLDTVSRDGASRRRLVILGFRGERQTAERILLERMP